MSNLSIPFNISILVLSPEILKGIKPVTALDIFDNTGKNYHEEGLFSTSIFGRSGEEIRDYRFSYIDIKVDILHPILFKSLEKIKSLYADIMSGKEFAYWDEDKKDFEKTTALNGETGYHFFMKHWKDIKFVQTGSDQREQFILLIEQFKDIALTNKIVVMPAGLRDIEIDASGRPQENEINPLYRKLIAVSNIINESAIKNNPEVINAARWTLQHTFNEIFELIKNIIEGKKKLILGKWASRKVFNGTRNVITAMNPNIAVLGEEDNIGFNDSMAGLFQVMVALLPITKYNLKNSFLSKVFVSKDLPVNLVDKKTLKLKQVNLKSDYFDRWTSDEGLEKVIQSFREENIRHQYIEISDCYLGLIYKGPDNTFKIIQDIDEVPESRDKKDVYPLTFCELLYISIYNVVHKYPGFVTRYPIAGIGSIVPSFIYLKTTNRSEARRELNDAWEIDTSKKIAKEFPIINETFMNSLVPHLSRISGLVAD